MVLHRYGDFRVEVFYFDSPCILNEYYKQGARLEGAQLLLRNNRLYLLTYLLIYSFKYKSVLMSVYFDARLPYQHYAE